jgi:hypothetical protein
MTRYGFTNIHRTILCLLILVSFLCLPATAGVSQQASGPIGLISIESEHFLDQDFTDLDDRAAFAVDPVAAAHNFHDLMRTSPGLNKVRFELGGDVHPTKCGELYIPTGDDPNGDDLSRRPGIARHRLGAIALGAFNTDPGRRNMNTKVTHGGVNYDQSRGDLISLHYDHMPDPDDGHATVAARTVTGYFGITPHVVAGTHSFPVNRKNAFPGPFQEAAMAVMSATWAGGWLNAHNYNNNNDAPNAQTVEKTALIWYRTLKNGGHVWVAEGGPSDFTAYVLRYLRNCLNYQFRTPRRIHVIQHGAEACANPEYVRLNERYTGAENLRYVQNCTDYKIIGNGNCHQSRSGKNLYQPTANFRSTSATFNQHFKDVAARHVYASAWAAAFRYWDPVKRGNNTALLFKDGDFVAYPWSALDFSDTVELMYILGIGLNTVKDCSDFADVFLSSVDG